jgi:hypothetical protein
MPTVGRGCSRFSGNIISGFKTPEGRSLPARGKTPAFFGPAGESPESYAVRAVASMPVFDAVAACGCAACLLYAFLMKSSDGP